MTLPDGSRAAQIVWQLAAGSIAGIVADATTHPIDTVRATLQYQRGFTDLKYGGTMSTFVKLARERALYRGFLAVGLTTVPAHALYFAGYEVAKKRLEKSGGGDQFGAHLMAGFFADVCGSLVWVPADVIKQRVQLSADKSSAEAFRRILRTDGVTGLFRGYWTCIAT